MRNIRNAKISNYAQIYIGQKIQLYAGITGFRCPNKIHVVGATWIVVDSQASTIKPSDHEVTELYSLANHVPFDDRICHSADMTDLNITLIKAYLKEVGSDLYAEADRMDFNQLCMKMEISNSTPEYMKPKNVGLLFFSMNPDKFMPYAQIDVVEFPDGVGGDRIVENIFKGPLHQ